MKKVLRITKITKLLRVADITSDLKSSMTDEEILDKYELTWNMLTKVYSRLFHAGYLCSEDLLDRLEMRGDADCSHIPLLRLTDSESQYECSFCGFYSTMHFTECPRCRRVNLRRLTREFMLSQSRRRGRGTSTQAV